MLNWHRYFFRLLFLSFCLSVLLSNHLVGNSLPITTNSGQARESNTLSLSLTQKVSKTQLDNGLTIITKEVHTAPVVSLQVWYGVGSSNEYPGVNGISHQLEHMLFKGTTNRPIQFGRLFSSLGSISNAFTSYDKTVYYNTVQRDQLEALLILEADRMQNVLINEQQLSTEKQVVISELEGYENSPSYNLNRQVMRAAFPQQSYGLPVGGTRADVEQLTVQQVQDFYRRYYRPDNAILVITGDFQTEQVLKKVEEIFGQLSQSIGSGEDQREGRDLISELSAPNLTTSSLVVLREPNRTALLEMLFRLPSVEHPDIPTLHVLEFILTEGRNSRLYKNLVASGLASNLRGYTSNFKELGWYKLYVTASKTDQLGQIYRVIEKTLTQIKTEGVTESELNRAKVQLEASLILHNRDVTNLGMQLGDDQIKVGDYRYIDRYLAGIEKVSAADVRQVAIKYLNKNNRTVGLLKPTLEEVNSTADKKLVVETSTSAAEPLQNRKPVLPVDIANYLPNLETTDAHFANAESDHSLCCLPKVKNGKTQTLPEKITLKNGLRILLLPEHSTPTITLTGKISAGNEFDSPSLAGLASLTANSLMSGTIKKDAATLEQILAVRGANLNFKSLRESVTFDGKSLARDLPILIHTLAEVLQNATFPEDELELERQKALTALKIELDTPWRLAKRTVQEKVYPLGHPFHIFPTRESLKNITRSDLVRFKAKHYRPDTTVLTLVGDFNLPQVRSLLEKELGSWQVSGKAPIPNYPSVKPPETIVYSNSVIPGKAQSITYIGSTGITRNDPRYYGAMVLNQILGADTLVSRLGTKIRDSLGLTYGIYSYFQAGRNAGSFLIEMQTSPQNTQQAISTTLELLRQLNEQGVSAEEVARAKTAIIRSYPVELADPDELAKTILNNEVYGLGEKELYQFSEKISQVTLEEVNQAAKDLLPVDNLVVVTAGPAILTSK